MLRMSEGPDLERLARGLTTGFKIFVAVYLSGVVITFVTAVISRLQTCGGEGAPCLASLAKAVVWAAIWPVYWPTYLEWGWFR
jgi:hypothetical protein